MVSNVENLNPQLMRILAKEVQSLKQEPLEGIQVILDDKDITSVEAIIDGPADTPYFLGKFRVKLTIQKDLHSQFISWVKKRRGKRLKAKDDVLFNAGVWSGIKAKELGLIDGIGDYYSVMKNIFGDDIKFKDFSKKTSWFKQKFFSKSNVFNSDAIMSSLINKIEERIIWSRYGL